MGFWGNPVPQTLTPADHPWRLKVPNSHPSWFLAAEGETLLLGRVTRLNPAPSLQRAGHSRSGGWLGTRSWHLLGTDCMSVPSQTLDLQDLIYASQQPHDVGIIITPRFTAGKAEVQKAGPHTPARCTARKPDSADFSPDDKEGG